jgi:hypothetical protein
MPWRRFLPEKLTVAQLLIQFRFFYTPHQSITIFTTAWITPSHLIPLAHLPSVLKHILHWTSLLRPTCLVHFKSNADMPNSETKKVGHWKFKKQYDVTLQFWHVIYSKQLTKNVIIMTTNENVRHNGECIRTSLWNKHTKKPPGVTQHTISHQQ